MIQQQTKVWATYGAFTTTPDFINVEAKCNHIGVLTEVYSDWETIEVPAMANQYDVLDDWIVLSHNGWSCSREFRYGDFAGLVSVSLPECGGQSACRPEANTRLRHWLEGYAPALFGSFEASGSVMIDGASYMVYRGSDWAGSHQMAGLGFVLKWETNVNGTHIEFPLTILGEISRRGPSVEVDWPNQILGSPSAPGTNYQVANTKVSFRMVLLAPSPDGIKNSDNNIFPVTSDLTLGKDHCQAHPGLLTCERDKTTVTQAITFFARLHIRHAAPTCDTPSVTVPMPTVPLAEFTATNAVSVHSQTPFTIKLINCSYAIRRNVTYSLSASSGTSPDPAIGLVPLTSDSAAAGVDVQILDANKTPLPLDTFHNAYTWVPGNPEISSLDIDLHAQLRRRGDAIVSAGTYQAAATFVIQYP